LGKLLWYIWYKGESKRRGHDAHTQISVHHHSGDPCLSRPRHPWLGWICRLLSHPALIALAIALFVLSGVALFSGGNLSPGEREDRANRWVIVPFALIGLLDVYLPAYTDRYGFWTLDGDAIRWLGVVLFAAGGVLRIWPVFVLGRRFSGLVAIQPGHTLVTRGVYGVIRHPSYLGLLVNSLGWASPFVRGSACCSRRSLSRHSSRASARKRGCCVRSSTPNTMLTAFGRHG
jgi:protein-S-isoprenylcysteine O-methyltransferase Ste14